MTPPGTEKEFCNRPRSDAALALAGSNFDDDRMGGIEKKCRSEFKRLYVPKSIVESKTRSACGVRGDFREQPGHHVLIAVGEAHL